MIGQGREWGRGSAHGVGAWGWARSGALQVANQSPPPAPREAALTPLGEAGVWKQVQGSEPDSRAVRSVGWTWGVPGAALTLLSGPSRHGCRMSLLFTTDLGPSF